MFTISLEIFKFCGGDTGRSGPILTISELNLFLTIILQYYQVWIKSGTPFENYRAHHPADFASA